MKKTRSEKAITLIALIVTIAALLIIATVSISTIKNDGLLSYANNQKSDIETEIAKKDNLLNQYGDFLNSDAGSSETAGNIVDDSTEDETTSGNNSTGGNNTTTDNEATDGGHVCSYVVADTSSTYLKTAATCTSKAVYYYSCSCGAKGTNTFESGKLASHTKYVSSTSGTATCSTSKKTTYKCNNCDWTETIAAYDSSNHKKMLAYTSLTSYSHELHYECQNCNDYYEYINTEFHYPNDSATYNVSGQWCYCMCGYKLTSITILDELSSGSWKGNYTSIYDWFYSNWWYKKGYTTGDLYGS